MSRAEQVQHTPAAHSVGLTAPLPRDTTQLRSQLIKVWSRTQIRGRGPSETTQKQSGLVSASMARLRLCGLTHVQGTIGTTCTHREMRPERHRHHPAPPLLISSAWQGVHWQEAPAAAPQSALSLWAMSAVSPGRCASAVKAASRQTSSEAPAPSPRICASCCCCRCCCPSLRPHLYAAIVSLHCY